MKERISTEKMNLRNQLKNTKMQKGETVHDYFSRVSQFKEQLEAIGDTSRMKMNS
jgi:hypothetical protein